MNSINLLVQMKISLKKKYLIVLQKKTKIVIDILNALWDEKIIYGYFFYKKDFIKIYLKFNKFGKSMIQAINLISTSGRRLFMSVYNIKKLTKLKKSTFFFFSTSKGILSHKKAIEQNVGGEILFSINL